MGAFILGSCFIDCLTSYYVGGDTTKIHFKDFVGKFLPSYDPEKLYTDLRCKLVHNYSEGGSYMFVDGHPEWHGKWEGGSKKTFINLENFIDALRSAMEQYFQLLETDIDVHERAVKRVNTIGLLGITRGEFVLTGSGTIYHFPENEED